MENRPQPSEESFFSLILSDWTYFTRAVLLFAIFLFGIYILITSLICTMDISALKISSDIAELEVTYQDNEQRFESILVHPRGWVDSDIFLHEGDEVILSANGSVNISFGSMVNSSQKEREIKKRHNNDIEKYLPEEIDSLVYGYTWNSPNGLDPDLLNKKATDSIRIYPHANLGQLLAVVCPGSSCGSIDFPQPPDQDAQIESYYHEKLQFIAKQAGDLRFIINDVTNPERRRNTLGWQDNVGFFSINLRVIRKVK